MNNNNNNNITGENPNQNRNNNGHNGNNGHQDIVIQIPIEENMAEQENEDIQRQLEEAQEEINLLRAQVNNNPNRHANLLATINTLTENQIRNERIIQELQDATAARQNNPTTGFKMHKPPKVEKFDGSPTELRRFEFELTNYFNFTKEEHLTDFQKIMLIQGWLTPVGITRLSPYIRQFGETINTMSYETFLSKLRDKIVPEFLVQENRRNLETIQQENDQSVFHYSSHFDSLAFECPDVDEATQCTWYLRGLNEKMEEQMRHVNQSQLKTLLECQSVALQHESNLMRYQLNYQIKKGVKPRQASAEVSHAPKNHPFKKQTSSSSLSSKDECGYCGVKGHKENDCRHKQQGRSRLSSRCVTPGCGSWMHGKDNCAKSKRDKEKLNKKQVNRIHESNMEFTTSDVEME